MRLIMTLLVKNEAEIVTENILFHLNQGVDFVIATDNLSDDGTADILREFERAGVCKLLIEPSQNYDQFRWVTRMARIACDDLGADWIVNNDADEFWNCPTGNLKDVIKEHPKENILTCPRFTLWPDGVSLANPDYRFYDNKIRANEEFQKRGTVRKIATIFEEHYKALHQAKGFKEVHQGNHWVTMESPLNVWLQPHEVTIYHFPFTTYERFERKIRVGGAAYKRNTELAYAVGSHWRDYYALLEQGRLKKEVYDPVVFDPHDIQYHLRRGDIVIDSTISEMVKKIVHEGE